MRFWQGAVTLAALAWSLPSSAALLGRDLDGNSSTFEAYYDTLLDITWLADANYSQTSEYDSDGRMTWSNATAWAASLNPYGSGITGWRLPDTDPLNGTSYNYNYSANGSTDLSYNPSAPGTAFAGSTGSEMAHLFFITLGNLSSCNPRLSTASNCVLQSGSGAEYTGPFSNLQSDGYWSGTVWALALNDSDAWAFFFDDGSQSWVDSTREYPAWAVRTGDVGAVDPVPLPAAAWLLLSGLAGLGLLGRRRARA